MLIHPSAKIMIAFCCWESSPNHVGHTPPKKSVSPCFILIYSLSISASWYSICLYKWALGISINKRRMGRCVHVYTQTQGIFFFLTDASPLTPRCSTQLLSFSWKICRSIKRACRRSDLTVFTRLFVWLPVDRILQQVIKRDRDSGVCVLLQTHQHFHDCCCWHDCVTQRSSAGVLVMCD